jgi:hypothetical protein
MLQVRQAASAVWQVYNKPVEIRRIRARSQCQLFCWWLQPSRKDNGIL